MPCAKAADRASLYVFISSVRKTPSCSPIAHASGLERPGTCHLSIEARRNGSLIAKRVVGLGVIEPHRHCEMVTSVACTACRRVCMSGVRHIVARPGSRGAAGCSEIKKPPQHKVAQAHQRTCRAKALPWVSCLISRKVRPSSPHGRAVVRRGRGPRRSCPLSSTKGVQRA